MGGWFVALAWAASARIRPLPAAVIALAGAAAAERAWLASENLAELAAACRRTDAPH